MSPANSKVILDIQHRGAKEAKSFEENDREFLVNSFSEKEHQKQLERARKEQRKAERGELRTEQAQQEESDSINDNKEIQQQQPQQQQQQQQPEQPSAVAAMHSEGLVRAAHSMTHDISHSEPVRKLIQSVLKNNSR